jgi:hypothetical protein
MKTFKFQNKLDHALAVALEPWGKEFMVPPMGDIKIDVFQTKTGLLETHLEATVLTIWLWAGCSAEVYINGEEQIGPSLSIPVPG